MEALHVGWLIIKAVGAGGRVVGEIEFEMEGLISFHIAKITVHIVVLHHAMSINIGRLAKSE